MTQDKLSIILAKQAELAQLIYEFEAAACRKITINECKIAMNPGEHYAGAVLDADGNHLHHLILMAATPTARSTRVVLLPSADFKDYYD